MNEQTLVKTVDIPPVPGFAWYADANIVGLSRHLDAAGRDRALNEVQVHWRRSCLHVAPEPGEDAPEPNRVAPMVPSPMSRMGTQPVATVS